MRRMLMILLLALGFLFPTFVSAEIYKWVDEKGTVHFTEDPGTIPDKHTEKNQSRTAGTILGISWGQLKEDERITYYYRNPNELILILESILREKDAISDSKTVKPLVHFFASALQKDLNKVKDLKALQQSYSGEARRLIQTMMEEAKNYHPADLRSPQDLELLWSEYKASGNKEIIEMLINVITATATSKTINLRDHAKQFLIKIAPYHSEVSTTLGNRYDTLTGSERTLLSEVVNTLTHNVYKPANEHLIRGENFYLQGNYDKALAEFNRGLSYFPDYCSIYMDIANIYDDQNRTQEAIKVGKRAVRIEPDNPRAIANVGMIHPASVLAATMLAAVRRSKWFSEICNLYGVRGPIFIN